MTSAVLNGMIGLILSLLIGTQTLDMAPSEVVFCVLISNIAAVISLLLTLRAEKVSWLKANWLNHFMKTWSFLTLVYFSIILTFCPSLRSTTALLYLSFPLILSTGFGILVFGPIQDQIVRKSQKKSEAINALCEPISNEE